MIYEVVSGRHLGFETPGGGDHYWRVIDVQVMSKQEVTH